LNYYTFEKVYYQIELRKLLLMKQREREEVILKQLEEKKPLPDKEDQMAWVRVGNQHRAIAEEIILKELIYV